MPWNYYCFIILDQSGASNDTADQWIFENSEFRSNYHISDNGRKIRYESSSALTTSKKEMVWNKKLRHDSTWIQHVIPLQPSPNPTNGFKTKVIEIGESIIADQNVGIEIGLASKLDSSLKTPHEWNKLGCHFNVLNGGIYHKTIYPMKFVERAEPNDVVEWTLSYSNTEDGQLSKLAVLKINGETKGKPLQFKGGEDLFPTIHIASTGAKVEAGYNDMTYPTNVKGK